MPIGGSMPAGLSLSRSVQSGLKVMLAAAAWKVVYTTSSTQPYIFIGAEIDLTNMQAGDSIDIRVRKILVTLGTWVNEDIVNYLNAQPVNHLLVHIPMIANVYGVEISMRQNAGVLRATECEFFEAKRFGL
jgi:hypothetical protein